jgi:tetratricopeptide (TPR) repeat protein
VVRVGGYSREEDSCEGARGSPRDAFSSAAATLVRSGIPAVVAMQYEITDRAAIEFSRSFYEALADGLPVDAVVAEARTAIKMGSALEWGTPVLYMRSEDGLIFDIPAEERHTQPAEPAEAVEDQEALLRRYREDVVSAWTGGELDRSQSQRFRDLADELGLSQSAAADIEREVMGDTIEAILERQERAANKRVRKERLDELYARARRAHQNQEWQTIIDLLEQIHAEDPAYPDREGLLTSAREAVEAQELARRVAALYAEGQRHMDAKEWQKALECFEDVQRLEPGYREIEELLSRVRQEVARGLMVEVPDLSGQSVSQAHSTLASKGLKLGTQSKASSATVPEGKIIEQSPEAGTEAKAGTSVSVTVTGPREATTVRVGPATRHDGHAESPDSGEQRRSTKWINVALYIMVFLGIGGLFLYLILVAPQPQDASKSQDNPQPQTLVVPDLVGMDVDSAKELYGEDFSIYVEGAKVAPGVGVCRGVRDLDKICTQNPKPGERDPRGSTISVVISG